MCNKDFANDKISIIIPIYNQEKYLDKCLQSLSEQTYSNISFLLIDDGSTDGSAEICKKYCEDDERFVYIYQDNAGVSAARNKGLEIADGDYMGFCDSDDWVENDIYEFLYNMIKRTDADIGMCGFEVEQGNNHDYVHTEEVITPEQAVKALYIYKNNGGGFLWNKLFKRSVIDGIKFNSNLTLYEDMVFVCEAYSHCNSIVSSNERKYHYFHNPQSALNGAFHEREWSGQDAQKALIEIISNKFPNIVSVAERGMLMLSMRLASRLVFARQLNKENYRRLRNDIDPHVNKQSLAFVSRLGRWTIRLFRFNRLIYTLFRKMAYKIYKR